MTGRWSAILARICVALLCCPGCSPEAKKNDKPITTEQPLSHLARLDSQLTAMYRLMWNHRDSLPSEYADTFEIRVQQALHDPATFDYPFDSLMKEGFHIVASDDRKIRVFSWGHPWSGTWRQHLAIIQTRSAPNRFTVQNARIFYKKKEFPSVAYGRMYHVHDSLYLILGGGQFMGKMPFEIAFGYVLSDTGVSKAVNLFPELGSRKRSSSLYLDKLWSLNRKGEGMSVKMMYHPDTRTLSYPELIDTASGKIVHNDVWALESVQPTGDTIRLRFNGKFFEPVSR